MLNVLNKKGFEMAISTIVIIIISLFVLVGLLVMIRTGFLSLDKGTSPLLKASSSGAIREACLIACRAEDANTFCCSKFTIDKQNVLCTNGTLDISCEIDCNAVVCS